MTIDLTGVLTAAISGLFTVLAVVIPVLINARMKDTRQAAVLSTAIGNSLGAMEQAARGVVTSMAPEVKIPGMTREMAVGVQYVLDHAGEEAKRFGVTPERIADKINARIGLQSLANASGAVPVSIGAVSPAAASEIKGA